MINGKKLAWAIIHLSLFLYMLIVDFGYKSFDQGFFLFVLMILFAWGFIENMGEVFE